MFGIWRTVLALLVIAFHLLAIPTIGSSAVFSFFVLSGFLMTTIMHESYGYDLGGRKRYAINRFLRLYPNYWLTLLIALGVVYFCGEPFVRAFMPELYAPDSLQSVIYNVTMIFPNLVPSKVVPRLAPTTWALTVEITYYVLIGLGISKTRKLSLVWLALSLLYVPVTMAAHLAPIYRYAAVPAGSLPFALGACTYFYKDDLRRLLDKWSIGPVAVYAAYMAVMAARAFAGWRGYHAAEGLGLYASAVLACPVVVRLDVHGVPGVPRRIDKLIGDYSYPIYLLQWPLAALSCFLLFGRPVPQTLSGPGLAVIALALVFIALAASFMIFVMDPAIERVRTRIRQKSRLRAPARTAAPANIVPDEAQ